VLFLSLARGPGDDLARVAAARTGVAVAIALTLAFFRTRLARPELTWIAWLALALGGLELLLVELPNGRASTLLVSFVVFGAGLILVPRLAPPGRDFLSAGRPR
jgi:membrane-bound ClpP family serine protease